MDMDSQYAAVGPVALNVAPYDYYIELKVSAAIADAELADILLCKEGDPLLLVRRTYIKRDGTPLSYNYRYLRQDIELFGRSDFRTAES